MAVHCLFYVPTISVTNTIAFASMSDPQRQFGPVRLWGTIGWIARELAVHLHSRRLVENPRVGHSEFCGLAGSSPWVVVRRSGIEPGEKLGLHDLRDCILTVGRFQPRLASYPRQNLLSREKVSLLGWKR
ncbi:MAG: hypothetical protein KatS3mg113_0138 [Planctomycetaceae bacterium]|nr:MAG: hypothetical protein KatS3mg113_0138 [Planctomycetaceae bacterium]